MKPHLTKDISIKDFKNYYWLKQELQNFCRENDMRTSGSKIELTKRIQIFLETGEKTYIKKTKTASVSKEENELSLATVITPNHRCSQQVRAFFKTVIPNFHFSTYIQTYFKENVGKTYQDVVKAWNEEETRKKDPTYQTNIAPQFEYNQFIRDFFQDPKNKGKTQKDAISAWNDIKKLPGSNKYNG